MNVFTTIQTYHSLVNCYVHIEKYWICGAILYEMDKISTDGDDLLGLTVEVTSAMEEAAVCLEMDAGSLSVHDSYVLHGSEANISGRRRAAYTMRYANANTVTVDTSEHWVPVYLVRGEAENADYVDIRLGQSLPDPISWKKSSHYLPLWSFRFLSLCT